jgi:hypothetical protein
MSGFKLLAIRPLKGCGKDYLKVLKPDKFYTFYNNYTFSENSDGRIKVEHTPSIEGLFDIKRSVKNLSVNVSAIVGQNGSGKSSLLELYYLCMYFIAINRKKPFLKPNLLSIENDLIGLDKKNPNYHSIKNQLINHQKEIKKIIKEFKVQLYYSVDDSIYIYNSSKEKIDDLEYDFVELIQGDKKEKRNFILSSLFDEDSPYDPAGFAYSCVVNYSIFGLNSIEMGNWITTLFHKNDAYRTPIVINPMRTNGDFNIEEENQLLSGRLLQSLAICLKQDKIKEIGDLLGTQRKPIKVIFKLKRDVNIGKLALLMDGSKELLFSDKSRYVDGEKIFEHFKKHIDEVLNIKIDKIINNNLLLRYCLEYAFSKAGRIFKKYPNFRGSKADKEFIELLLKDRSHITLKFRQSINFIVNNLFKELKATFLKRDVSDIDLLEIAESDYKQIIELSLDEIKNNFEKEPDEISNVPPPIFEIDFSFSKNINDRTNLLSSGESQSTHSLNSIYYHLRNVESMNKDELGFDYEYINIILDEVELYHHPEMQRTYLYRLLRGIEALNLKKIRGINIIFSTHSPFILSDIPSANILKLEKGEQITNNQETFAANIHELLGSSFFLRNGYVGEFAKTKIEELIKFYNDFDSKGENQIHNFFNRGKAQEFISIIDDKLIKDRLQEMHDFCFEKTYVESFESEKDYETWLENELIRIKENKDDKN